MSTDLDVLHALGLVLIGVDRPGYGASTRDPHRSFQVLAQAHPFCSSGKPACRLECTGGQLPRSSVLCAARLRGEQPGMAHTLSCSKLIGPISFWEGVLSVGFRE